MGWLVLLIVLMAVGHLKAGTELHAEDNVDSLNSSSLKGEKGSTVSLRIDPHGHVDHYYHFTFAVFLPLIEFRIYHKESKLIYCGASVGSFARILEVFLPDVEIRNSTCKGRVLLNPYDGNAGLDVHKVSGKTRRAIIQFISDAIPPQSPQPPPVDILLIGRLHKEGERRRILSSNKPEKTDKAKYSGADRRDIRNFKELQLRLEKTFGETRVVRTVFLEQLTFAEQFSLFRRSRVIIGQHGAGLSNLFFCPKNVTAGVIEISPYSGKRDEGKFTRATPLCFKHIANKVGIGYVKITQPHEFSYVNISEVILAAKSLLSLNGSSVLSS